MSHNLCTLSNLAIKAGDRRLLAGLDLNIGTTGFYAIMGPVGVGKSTLLAVLGGRGNSNGLNISHDVFSYAGAPLDPSNHPIVIKQASRSEQTQRTINGGTIKANIQESLSRDPAMLCLDEPTAGVAHSEAMSMLHWLKEQSRRRAIVMVTHNSKQARFFADWVVLLGGGGIVEQGTAEAFFNNSDNPATKHFIKTGSLSLPRLDAHPRQLAPEHRGLLEGINTQTVGSADGILNWIIRRSFAIVQAEGVGKSSLNDLVMALQDRSISVVAISDKMPPEIAEAMRAAGISIIFYNSPDVGAPREIRSSLALANQIGSAISQGLRVAVLQTKTERVEVLAAVQLIHTGITAKDAVDLLNVKAADVGIHTHDEQFLWDLELVLDLCADIDQVNTGSPLEDTQRNTKKDNAAKLVDSKGSNHDF
ncbi:MAG: hypothetical protein L3J37_11900 [Rhodobacteraceae bacterium]|nr:hypothetical protein [Paracoccaceae bacterium]